MAQARGTRTVSRAGAQVVMPVSIAPVKPATSHYNIHMLVQYVHKHCFSFLSLPCKFGCRGNLRREVSAAFRVAVYVLCG